ncbi:crustacean hyperglycemic hormones B-like [Portunus trituberculatus]|uniref:Crustacean hyperglycemic hormone n=1 Tax=Portunus trituberculatus TaxID=210409 RepID=A0A5B7GR79_PORTR|nr:crustacean hyperglycemic hormones B-like [Portunus trituberculatus]MPC59687.1 Crustacean hyperglycemic hormone [Portunus trituberculatus]
MVSQTCPLSLLALWMSVLAAAVLMQASVSSGARLEDKIYRFRLWPGTEREFQHYQCGAEFNKETRKLYNELSSVCEDCRNVYRYDPFLRQRCMSNCFDNDMFFKCTDQLMYPIEKIKDYEDMKMQIKA